MTKLTYHPQLDALRLVTALGRLRLEHKEVEGDCFWSCPKSGSCCNDDLAVDYCNCGADAHNAILDEIIGVVMAAVGKGEVNE